MTTPNSPTSTGGPSPASAPIIAALQAALRAEHQAVFGYAALGPRLSAAEGVTARSNEAAHRSQRDRTEAQLTGFGAVPAPSAVSYAVPALTTPGIARRYARTLENDAAAAWRYVIVEAAINVPTTVTAAIRVAAVSALTASAVRALRWSELIEPTHPTVALPGL